MEYPRRVTRIVLNGEKCNADRFAYMPHLSNAVIFVQKEPRRSIECINEHTLKNMNFSVLQILFLFDLRKYSNILR